MENIANNSAVVSLDTITSLNGQVATLTAANASLSREAGAYAQQVKMLETNINELKQANKDTEKVLVVRKDSCGSERIVDTRNLDVVKESIEAQAKKDAEKAVENELNRLKDIERNAEYDRVSIIESHSRDMAAMRTKLSDTKSDYERKLQDKQVVIDDLKKDSEYRIGRIELDFKKAATEYTDEIKELKAKLADKSEVQAKEKELADLKESISKLEQENLELQNANPIRKFFRGLFGKSTQSFGKILSKEYVSNYWDDKTGEYKSAIKVYYTL